jgi:hypothetical protein
MSFVGLLRIASFAVPIGLGCGGTLAQQIVTVPPGAVGLLVRGPQGVTGNPPEIVASRRVLPVADTPAGIERIFAEQLVIMDRMMADMNALFAQGPESSAGYRAEQGPGPVAEPGAGPVTTIDALMDRVWKGFGTMPNAEGGSFCAESMTVTDPGDGKAPVVKVSRTGNGCGPMTGVAPEPAQSSPTHIAPGPSPRDLYEVNDPAPMGGKRVLHHT